MDKQLIWTNQYHISSFDVYASGKASMYTLCKFMQETAYNHANHLEVGYSQLKNLNQIWVLSRLKVTVSKFPEFGDDIKILTWPSGREGLFAYRDFQILDKNETQIGIARSAWIVLNIETRRPQRIDGLLAAVKPLSDKQVFKENPDRIPALSNPQISPPFVVRFSDLDVQNHVNNAKYIEWIFDNYHREILENKKIEMFEINFLAESSCGEQISISTESQNDFQSSFLHSIIRLDDNRELCRAKATWNL